jgi:hypothetical protein
MQGEFEAANLCVIDWSDLHERVRLFRPDALWEAVSVYTGAWLRHTFCVVYQYIQARGLDTHSVSCKSLTARRLLA